MPLYEYNCHKCGTFTKARPVSESSALGDCPACGALAVKVFPVVNLRSMRSENRTAWERNERSASAPHVCGSGCSHRFPTPARKTPKKYQGSTKRNSRPWMLGH